MTDDPIRAAFETWYVKHAFDYVRNPIGSRECGLQWDGYRAGRAAALEEAAKACEERGAMFDDEDAIASIAAELCASRIRAMVKP